MLVHLLLSDEYLCSIILLCYYRKNLKVISAPSIPNSWIRHCTYGMGISQFGCCGEVEFQNFILFDKSIKLNVFILLEW